MIFQEASGKSETAFVKQNRELVQKSGFRYPRRPSEHDELFNLLSEIQVLGSRLEKSRFLFGLFRGATPKSKISLVNQLSILFHKYFLRCSGRASEHHAKDPTAPTSLINKLCEMRLEARLTLASAS